MPGIINEKKPGSSESNPIGWLEQYGDYLYGFAFSRLHNETAAEDLVQETLLAAWQSYQKFAGNSSEKTWLIGILKHKIIDYYRHSSRQETFVLNDGQTDEEMFDESGVWHENASPAFWNATPEAVFEQKEFQKVLQKCLAELPENLLAVFTLREIEGFETGEICEILDLSPNNLWVMLHRARLQLRREIEANFLTL